MKRKGNGAVYLAASVLLAVCCGAKLFGIAPFGAPMYCALAASGGGMLALLSAEYVLCGYLFTLEAWRLYVAGGTVIIMAARWFLARKVPRSDNSVVRAVFAAAAIAYESALAATGSATSAILTAVTGAAFLYFAKLTAGCIVGRFSRRPSVPESAALCVTLGVAGLTFSRAVYAGGLMGMAPAYFILLMLAACGTKPTLAGGASIAMGLAIADVPTAMAFVASAGVVAAIRTLPRPVYALTGACTFAAFCVLLGSGAGYIWRSAAAASTGGLIFCLIPRRSVKRLTEYLDFDGAARLAVRHYINLVKAGTGDRVLGLAEVFDETARLMGAIREPQPDIAATAGLMRERICPYCTVPCCDGARADEAFTAVAASAQAGRSALTELPAFFTDECTRTADVIALAGSMTDAARERIKRSEGETRARELLTERFAAVKDVLTELGRAEATPVGFDGSAEKAIAMELSARGIECAEAFVTRTGVTAIVRTVAAARRELCRAVSACLKRSYELVELTATQAAGWSVATLKKRPMYEAVYARAGVSKSGGVSGDSYTFKRIGDRFLVALFDGMGAGEGAGMSSGAAVELIECFYRAGFDSRSVLAGVNRFLKTPGGESYSAADVAVCDLDTAELDMIKLGAPACYIKTADTVLKVDGGSLPIGVLDEMRPYVTAKRLYPGQTLILVTDGVSDCFDGDELPEFINGLPAHNPERVASAVIERALSRCGKPRDDMTAIVFRLITAPRK